MFFYQSEILLKHGNVQKMSCAADYHTLKNKFTVFEDIASSLKDFTVEKKAIYTALSPLTEYSTCYPKIIYYRLQ